MIVNVKFISGDDEILYDENFDNISEAEEEIAILVCENYDETEDKIIVTVNGRKKEWDLKVTIHE